MCLTAFGNPGVLTSVLSFMCPKEVFMSAREQFWFTLPLKVNSFSSHVLAVKQEPDFNLTCPSLWIDGTVASSTCVIPVVKLTKKPNGVCDIVSDTVVFQLTTVKGSYLTCAVSKINTTCNGTLNNDGCGCRERNEERYIVDYNITAVMIAAT